MRSGNACRRLGSGSDEGGKAVLLQRGAVAVVVVLSLGILAE